MAEGAVNAIGGVIDSVKATGSLVGTLLRGAFGDEPSQQALKTGAGKTWDYVKNPDNWPYLFGAMTPEQREQLAQAYENGDGKTVGQLLGEQATNLLSNLPSGGATGTIKLVKAVDKVEDVGGLVKGVNTGLNAAEGVVASRINVRTGDANVTGSGLEYAWKKHGGAWGDNKSAFTISKDELKVALQDPLVVNTPAYQSATSGNYIRTVDMGRTVGIDAKIGGQPTNFITIITDSKGNLVNTFPGRTF